MNLKLKHEKASNIAKAIGNPLRFRILTELVAGSSVVSKLLEKIQVEPTILSKHLAILRSVGLIDCDVEWRCRRYSLKDVSSVRLILDSLHRLSDEGDLE